MGSIKVARQQPAGHHADKQVFSLFYLEKTKIYFYRLVNHSGRLSAILYIYFSYNFLKFTKKYCTWYSNTMAIIKKIFKNKKTFYTTIIYGIIFISFVTFFEWLNVIFCNWCNYFLLSHRIIVYGCLNALLEQINCSIMVHCNFVYRIYLIEG